MRQISWLKSALKEFRTFPQSVQDQMLFALEVAATGQKAGIAKPMKGFDSGVFELTVGYRSDAFRTVYAVKLGEAIWVLHAFQKKSTHGIATPKHHIDVIHERIKRIRDLSR